MSLLLLTPPSTPTKSRPFETAPPNRDQSISDQRRFHDALHHSYHTSDDAMPPSSQRVGRLVEDSSPLSIRRVESGEMDGRGDLKQQSLRSNLLMAISPPPFVRSSPAFAPSSTFSSCSDFFPSFADFLPHLEPSPTAYRGEKGSVGTSMSGELFRDASEAHVGLGIIFEEGRNVARNEQRSMGKGRRDTDTMRDESFTFFPSPSFISSASSSISSQSNSDVNSRQQNFYPTPPLSNLFPAQSKHRIDHKATAVGSWTPPRSFGNASDQQSPSYRPNSRSLSSLSPVFVPMLAVESAGIDRMSASNVYTQHAKAPLESSFPSADAVAAASTVLSHHDIELVAHLHGGRIPSLAQMMPAEPGEDLFLNAGQPEIVNTGNQGPMIVQVGDWQCGVCTFVNWRRRRICMRCFPFANDIGKLLTINSQRAATLAYPMVPHPIPKLSSSQSAPSNLSSISSATRPTTQLTYPSTLKTPFEPLPSHLRGQSNDESQHGYHMQRTLSPSSLQLPATTPSPIDRYPYQHNHSRLSPQQRLSDYRHQPLATLHCDSIEQPRFSRPYWDSTTPSLYPTPRQNYSDFSDEQSRLNEEESFRLRESRDSRSR